MGTIKYNPATLALRTPQMRICSMGGNESLGLRRDGGKHAFLVETGAVVAAAILRVFKARASDLLRHFNVKAMYFIHIYNCPWFGNNVYAVTCTYLPSATIPASDCGSLSRSSGLVNYLRSGWWRLRV